MRKLTLLFLASALGASVFGAEPKFKVGDEVKLGGKVLVVVSLDDNGDPLFKTKADLKPEKKEPGFFATLFSSKEEKELHPADKVAEDFLASLRRRLKEKGKELSSMFGINEGDLDDIFDVIAKEHPDL